ncbi:hypothetical protein ACTFIY_006459 [Dictyostelium cf. discoideum]
MYVESQDLVKGEYDCLLQMAINTNNLGFFTPNGTGYYNFCVFSIPTFKPYCNQGSITSYQISPYGNNNYNLIGSDFLCLPKVGLIMITAKTIVSQFFTSQWSSKVNDIRLTSNSDIQFAPLSRSFRNIQLTIYTQPQPTIIYFSWFINTTQLAIETTSPFKTNTSHLIYYENDIQKPWTVFLFRIISMNIPSFEKITNFGLLTINLNPGFDKTSFINLKTAKNISTIELISKEISPFPQQAINEILTNPLTLFIKRNTQIPENFRILWEVEVPNKVLIGWVDISEDLPEVPKVFTIPYPYPLPTFWLSWEPLIPHIENVTWNDRNLNFYEIEIGGEKCIVSSVTFFEINCTILNLPPTIDILTYVTVGNLTNQITLTPNYLNIIYNYSTCICDSNYQGLDCTISYKPCQNDCSGFGSCNNQTGICICDSSHQSPDCSLPFKECPMGWGGSGGGLVSCSGYGSCNNQTGICTCLEDRIFDDCSGITCSPKDDCNISNGFCDNSIGKCKCLDGKWSGNDCMIPYHYVTSIIPSSSECGEATFFGFFGNEHSNLSITIGGLPCDIIKYSSDSINCTSPAGISRKSITIFQNNITFTSDTLYQYQIINKPCPNDCISIKNGKCNSLNGYCECNENWKGIDCRYPITSNNNNNNNNSNNDDEEEVVQLPQSNSTIDKNTGSVEISNQQISYEISMVSLTRY